jgi:MFS family permease
MIQTQRAGLRPRSGRQLRAGALGTTPLDSTPQPVVPHARSDGQSGAGRDDASDARVPRHILATIALAQLGGTSLWFAANAIDADLQRDWALASSVAGAVTSAVQGGFLAGTLCYALLMIADRFSPRKVYLVSSLLAAIANVAVLLMPAALWSMTGTRFGVGFFLAGIYPVGMKIASGWYRKGLGGALGFMVGALILGTALPHAMRAWTTAWPWQSVIVVLSILAASSGVLMWLLVPDGPYLAKGGRVSLRALTVIWRDRKVRASVFGYFGHMWELYGVLMVIPLVFAHYLNVNASALVSWLSFAAIGAGAIGCAAGGVLAARLGSGRVAAAQLLVSGLCCLLSPWLLTAPWWLFVAWMIVWGTTVSGDSPQFSALTARNCPPEVVGSVLTLVNCIGFGISIVSIQLVALAIRHYPFEWVLPWLAIGPVVGLCFLPPVLRRP